MGGNTCIQPIAKLKSASPCRLSLHTFGRPCHIGIFHSQHKGRSSFGDWVFQLSLFCHEPIVQGGPGASHMQTSRGTGCESHARRVLVGLRLALEWKVQYGIVAAVVTAAIDRGCVGFARGRRLKNKGATSKVLVKSLGLLQFFNQANARVSRRCGSLAT